MKRGLDEPLTVATLMRDCGPAVLFAHEYKLTIPALRLLSEHQRRGLEPILFAMSHIGIAIPHDCINSCLAVYKDIASHGYSLNAYSTACIDPLLTLLPFNYRLVLLDGIRKMLSSILANVDTIPTTPEKAMSGDFCREVGCICMLIGKSIYNIGTIEFKDVAPLWLTKCSLTSSRLSSAQKKSKHEEALFSDTEEEEYFEQEQLWHHNSVPLPENIQNNDDDSDFTQRNTVVLSL